MMRQTHVTITGFVQFVILVVIAVLILSYFNVDLQGFIERPIVQKNLQTLWDWSMWVWEHILRAPVMYIWNIMFDIIIKKPLVENLNI